MVRTLPRWPADGVDRRDAALVERRLAGESRPDHPTPRDRRILRSTFGLHPSRGRHIGQKFKRRIPIRIRLTFAWEIRPEVEIPAGSYAGSMEQKAKPIDGLIRDPARQQVEFTAPQATGPYRIFVTIFDGKEHAAYGNVPFLVTE